jgi:hypothetical protein
MPQLAATSDYARQHSLLYAIDCFRWSELAANPLMLLTANSREAPAFQTKRRRIQNRRSSPELSARRRFAPPIGFDIAFGSPARDL